MGDLHFDLESLTDERWSWDKRREAQEITPYLYLGGSESARNLAQLHSNGITGILTVGSEAERATTLRPRFPQAFEYHFVSLACRSLNDWARFADSVRQSVDSIAESGNGKVLVHDDSGIDRAPAAVVLYLMDKYKLPFTQAATHVQNRRYCVSLGEDIKAACIEYETYCANRDSAQSFSLQMSAPPPPISLKRSNGHLDHEDASRSETMTKIPRKQAAR